VRLIGHLIGGGLGVLLLASAAPAQEGPVQITFNADTLAWTLARQPEGLAPPMMEHRVDGGWMIDRALRDGHSIDDLIRSPRIVASVVLATSPLTAWVLPSEHYYYFEIQAHGRRIAGNLRFTDAGAGKLHCGVYDRDNTSFMGYAVLAEGDGLVIKSEAGGPHPIYHVRDEATGVERRFVVPLPHMPPAPLMPGEELISPVLDESGFQFLLVYDRACCQFKYLLTAAPLDQTHSHDGVSRVSTFEPSGFRCWRDPFGRDWLAAVTRKAVEANTFQDGPFDQVPPHLALRPLILEAYPGIEAHAGDTLDEHGNWQGRTGIRVAISPYAEVSADAGPWAARARALWAWTESAAARGGLDPGHGFEGPANETRTPLDWDSVLERAHRWPIDHLMAESLRVDGVDVGTGLGSPE